MTEVRFICITESLNLFSWDPGISDRKIVLKLIKWLLENIYLDKNIAVGVCLFVVLVLALFLDKIVCDEADDLKCHLPELFVQVEEVEAPGRSLRVLPPRQ